MTYSNVNARRTCCSGFFKCLRIVGVVCGMVSRQVVRMRTKFFQPSVRFLPPLAFARPSFGWFAAFARLFFGGFATFVRLSFGGFATLVWPSFGGFATFVRLSFSGFATFVWWSFGWLALGVFSFDLGPSAVFLRRPVSTQSMVVVRVG